MDNIRQKTDGKSPIPNNKPFKKGQSGNPNGRPKGVRNFKTVIEEIFALPIDTLEEELKLKILGLNPKIKTIEDAFNARLVVDALEGDSYSKKEILERIHGKVSDKLDANINSTTIEYTKEERKEFLRKYLSDRTNS